MPAVILSRAFVAPNANYMSTVHAPYHGRLGVRDGTMREARLMGLFLAKDVGQTLRPVLIKITECLAALASGLRSVA